MAILKSAKKSEMEVLSILGIAIGGGIGLYALAKNAGGIGDFIGKIFGAFGQNIENNIVGALSSGGSSSSGGGGSTGGIKYAIDPNSYQTPPYQNPSTQQQGLADQQANLKNPTKVGVPDLTAVQNVFLAHGDIPSQYSQLLPEQQTTIQSLLSQAITRLNAPVGINIAGRPDLKAQNNLLVENLAANNNLAELGFEPQANQIYKLPNGSILPLSPDAYSYYVTHGQHPVLIS